MKLPISIIDAFTNKAFSGNPAAVCLLKESIPDEQMQTIAMEMNLSETAFVEKTKDTGYFGLRWFTPTLEIDLCGHATLASSFHMLQSGWATPGDTIHFQTKSGELRVKSDGEWLEMDFPLIPTFEEEHPYFKDDFFGEKVIQISQLRKNWIIELEDFEAVTRVIPDLPTIAANSEEGIIITAKGKEPFDIYSRFFGPNVGVDEDPVTGFAHCALMDYWYQKTGKFKIKAFQASKRGGVLHLEKHDDRVILRGQAVHVLEGTIDF
ncbi:PhzF family phenazine biosynthesis protein [Algoriphagus machipongonensis]|uniref:Phenazine biosynthesis protein PhzF family protein n=1 Tax=Algoriphagus machipongonensis TaxID=388413 RepID=A3HS95_9BACT|nr:PhzF family phenazine biosynthesis isomerase [Algoriphagus machipongonensis]EAZ82713.1 phenazine biosynthesis protein PhzF family protein [Algoriphagus machipongonensis]